MIGVCDQIAKEHLRRVKIKDDYISAACPIHKGGNETNPSFWIHRATGRWGCFSCHVGGASLRYLLKELGVRSRGIELEIARAESDAEKTLAVYEVKRKKKAISEFRAEYTLPDALLGVYDFCPQAMLDKGFSMETLMSHDIGYDKSNDRITFPIRDIYGSLVGISGRTTTGAHPKYLVYSGRRMIDGKEVLGELGEWYPEYSNAGVKDHLWRSQFIYNELDKQGGDLIIVEGYNAALSVLERGYKYVVALMGSKMSPGQERIVRRLGVPTWVLLDNNEPGLIGARQICQTLAVSTFPVYQCSYPTARDENTQPDDLNDEELDEVLSTAKPAGGRLHAKFSNRKQYAKTKGFRQKARPIAWRGRKQAF